MAAVAYAHQQQQQDTLPPPSASSIHTTMPSPGGVSLPVTEWQDSHIASWLSSLGLGPLSSSFREQGITGDVLVQLDNEALKDLGVDSVGQRLNLLDGIYRLKETWGIEMEEGDWRPQSEYLSVR